MILLRYVPSKLIIFMDFWYIMQWINPIKLIEFTFRENRSSKSRFITCGYAEVWESRWQIFVIYISGLFNDSVCNSDWITSNDWMILSNESEGMWKEVAVAWSEALVRNVYGGTEINQDRLQDGRALGQHSNLAPPRVQVRSVCHLIQHTWFTFVSKTPKQAVKSASCQRRNANCAWSPDVNQLMSSWCFGIATKLPPWAQYRPGSGARTVPYPLPPLYCPIGFASCIAVFRMIFENYLL